MNMPCDNGISGIYEDFAGGDQVTLQAHGLSGNSFAVEYTAKKPHDAGFSVRPPLLSGQEEIVSKPSSETWQGWHTEGLPLLDTPCSKYCQRSMEIKELMPWVRIIAQKIHRPLPSNIMLNDLIQDGMIGLVTAFREHDTDSGVPFHAFAANKIRWAIMDGLRAGDWAEKSVRAGANKVTRTSEKLQALLHREPSKGEIADALGLRVEAIASILGNAYGYNFVRINDGVEGEVQDIPDSRMEPASIAERREAAARAVAGLRTLQTNERRAFILRIMCDMSVLQTAAEMGVSESRVSQLYKAASKKLAIYVSSRKPRVQ